MLQPLTLANAFVERHGGEFGIQHMKLQKLCYYTYGWWLTEYDRPLLIEGPEVWRYGPVFSKLYNDLSAFGNRPINRPQEPLFTAEGGATVDDDLQIRIVDWIWRKYGRFSAIELSDMTHRQGTPWRQLAEKHGYRVPKHLRIPDELLKTYFKSPQGRAEIE